MEHKSRVCRKCDKRQPIDNFSKFAKGKYRRHECRGCVSKRQLVCYEKKIEERKENMKIYIQTYVPSKTPRIYRNWNG